MTKYGHIISNVQTTGLDSKRERGGLVVESLIPEQEVWGLIPTSTMLCP